MMKEFKTVEFLIFLICIEGFHFCPPHEEVQPCECNTRDDQSVDVRCSDLLQTSIFEHILDNIKEYRLDTFDLLDSSMMYIPNKLKSAKGSNFILIRDSTFVSFFDSEAHEVSSTKNLNIDNVKVMRGFMLKQLSSFKYLERLSISCVNIRGPIDMIKNVSLVLEQLVLNSNKIRKLEDYCFSDLKKLIYLTIENNPIRILKRNMFPSSLVGIIFSQNKISSLPEDLFSGMDSLFSVEIRNNFLTTISRETFLPIFSKNKYAQVYLRDNLIECGCALKWLVDVPSIIIWAGECAAPLTLRDREFRSLTNKDFAHCFYYYEVL